MERGDLIPLVQLCRTYDLEISFFNELSEIGLIDLISMDQDLCLHHDYIGRIEKIIRMHTELRVNIEGIDVIFNLLQKVENLESELNSVKNRLGLYEDF